MRKGGYILKLIPRTGYLLENSVSLEKKLRDGYRKSFQGTFLTGASIRLKDGKRGLNPTKIYNSGIFHRIYLNELKTGDIDITEYLNNKKVNLLTIDKPNFVKKRARIEYLAWKKAFNLQINTINVH